MQLIVAIAVATILNLVILLYLQKRHDPELYRVGARQDCEMRRSHQAARR
jgi:hypothetical protein